MRHYCTLFDSKYLPQGLTLYESLKRHSSEEFTLDVLPMDAETEETLIQMCLPGVVLIHGMHDKPAMRKMRESRTHQEYCWASASQLAEALMLTEVCVDGITYLDADMMFFSDPKVIHDEIGERSIAVIPHRFIPSKQYLEVNGKFNVSWVTFKNNSVGRECLSTWAWQCREKCSLKDGCGDQKYLDAWPEKYGHELCVIQNIGAGLAPWNLANYELTEGPKVDGRDVVFHHYHEFRELPVSKLDHRIADMVGIAGNRASYRLTNYELRPGDIKLIYEPYIQAVSEAKDKIETISV